MIYTVTLNPTLDITYVLEEVTFGETVEALQVHKTPGGKGINVSRALRAMGTDSIALTIAGGHVGDEVLDLLHDEGLILQVVRIKNETRTNVIVLGRKDGRELMIRAAGPPVQMDETEQVESMLFEITQAPEVLVLSGSIPPGIHEDIYASLTLEGRRRGSRVIVDCRGGALARAVEAGPYLIKPNVVEFSELAGRDLADDAAVIEFARQVIEGGVEVVVVSMGKRGALMISRELVLRGVVPSIREDTVGAGDSMVAGLVRGTVESLPLEQVFHMGLAFSVSAVLNKGPGLTEPGTYGDAYSQVAVETVERV